MAAPPLKSQPLHNFSFPDLKWARKNPSPATESTSQQQRLRSDSPDQNHHRRAGDHSQSQTKTGNHHKQPPPALPRNDVVLHEEEEEEENGEGKPWNLRRRKEVAKAEPNPKRETAAENTEKKIVSNSNGAKSQRRRGLVEGGQINGGTERKEKSKLWISLSRREIEEDIYALTGGKPARRPRKWPKNVQKQLDNLFPGLYLVGVSPDSYQKGV